MELTRLKKYYGDNSLIINCTIVAILFFVNCFVQDFSYVAFSAVGILIVISKMNVGFSTLIFSIPYCCLDGYPSIYLFLACLLIFLIRSYIVMIFFDKKRLGFPVILSILLFFGYVLFPVFDYTWAMAAKLIIIGLLVAFFYLFICYKEEINIKFNISILAISMVVSACFYLTYFISPYMASKTVYYHNENFIRFSCLLINPNTLAMMSEICLALLTYFIIANKFEWIDAISYVTFAVLGVFTLSKTFLILFMIMFIILVIYLLRQFKKQLFWIVICICIALIMIVLFANDFLFTYLRRFMNVDPTNLTMEEILNVITTHRYGLWKGVIDYMLMNPSVLIFGRGLGAPLIESMSAHNFYISLIYEVGVVGAVLFIGIFVTIYFSSKKVYKLKFDKKLLVPMIIIGMLMMVEDLFLFIY